MDQDQIKIIECPRDAMQGITGFIPTSVKVEYLNRLLRVGFDTLDFGSFVSPKAVPQMQDTREIIARLEPSSTKLLAIVANNRGIDEACLFSRVDQLGFPFSISETFQKRNTGKGISESLDSVKHLLSSSEKYEKQAVVYLSMAFGNPYGDDWSAEMANDRLGELVELGVSIISLADTTGLASPEQVRQLFTQAKDSFDTIELGVHLHSNPSDAEAKLAAAFEAGCRRFDSALRGFGGCPMAEDHLVGNIATESLLSFLEGKGYRNLISTSAWQQAFDYSGKVFG